MSGSWGPARWPRAFPGDGTAVGPAPRSLLGWDGCSLRSVPSLTLYLGGSDIVVRLRAVFSPGYPEETYPIHDLSDGVRRRPETILVDFPDPQEPSAEEIAERMELPEEEEAGRLGREMPAKPRAPEDGAAAPGGPRPETCSCCFPAQEDPAVLAEHAGFGADGPSEREEGAREEPGIGAARACVGGALRRRSPQGSE